MSQPPQTTTDEHIVHSVVTAVAESKGVATENLTVPLYDAVDIDALGQLFAPTATGRRREGTVNFRYDGHSVTVHGDGSVSVDDTESGGS